MSFTKLNMSAQIQFGNPSDTSGFRIAEAKIIGTEQRIVEVFLVQDGNLFGIATKHRLPGMYYCTMAVNVGTRFDEFDVARMLGVPVEMIIEALDATA